MTICLMNSRELFDSLNVYYLLIR